MSCPEEDRASYLKTAVLSEKRDFLCKNITPKTHYPYLRSRYILSEEDEELIEIQQLRRQKVHKFVDILETKGSKAFDELVKSLIQERTQLFIAEELNKAFEEKKKRLEVLLAGSEVPAHVPVTVEVNGVDAKQNQESILRSSKTSGTCPTVLEPHRSSVSDLGVDTDKLPKPVMPNKLSKSANDSLRPSGEYQFVREKSVEENEDKSSRTRSISSSST